MSFDRDVLEHALRRSPTTYELRPRGLPTSVFWAPGFLRASETTAWLGAGIGALESIDDNPGVLSEPLHVGDLCVTGWLPSRHGSTQIINLYLTGARVRDLQDRIAQWTGAPASHVLPDLRIRRYRDTWSAWHWDTGRGALATVVVFLQTLPRARGGATLYRDEQKKTPRLAVEPLAGAALLHINLDADGSLDQRWKHASARVHGSKWVLLASVLQRPARPGDSELQSDLAQR